MTLEKANISVDALQRIRDRSFEDAYEVHDIGYDILVSRLKRHGFEVDDHGDDARHVDGVFYGEGPDLAVRRDGETVAYVEIKTKEIPEWFGRVNLRHFREYVNVANEVDVPVFLWFALVDRETETLHREAFVRVRDTSQIEADVIDVGQTRVVFEEDDVDVLNDDEGTLVVDGDDVVGVYNDEILTEYIPSVHGNEVVELNDDEFRSFPHFLYHATDGIDHVGRFHRKEESTKDDEQRTITERLDRARELLGERTQRNPKCDVVQLRTAKGRMGPAIDEESEVALRVNADDSVIVEIDGEYVDVGSL